MASRTSTTKKLRPKPTKIKTVYFHHVHPLSENLHQIKIEYHNLSLLFADKQRSQGNVTVPLPQSYYAKGQSLLTSALIEMLNNEPNLQEVPIYRVKTRNSGDRRETRDNASSLADYNVGETVYTGTFNLKVSY